MDEANWPSSFDMEHFKALTSFKARMDYCQAHLTRIGGGTGRMVYQIDDQTVIKLAKNAKGVAQNEAEDNEEIQRQYDHIITKVLDRHPNHLWVESEMAKKVTRNRFKELSGGISIEDVGEWMTNYELMRNGSRTKSSQDPEISDRIWNNEFFYDVGDMANVMNIRFGDFGVLSSYGELNGELKVVDYGISSDVYSTHYERKPKPAMYYEIRNIIRSVIKEDFMPKDEITDLNQDYAIVKRAVISGFNYFIFSKKENKVISSFFNSFEAARDEALTLDAKNANLTMMNQCLDYIRKDVPNFFIQEGGIEEILHFLAQEDGMNLRLQWTNDGGAKLPDFSNDLSSKSDDELDRILQNNKIPYSMKDVRARLAQYFMRRLVYNTPTDRMFKSKEEALIFIKTYEQQFYYEYLKGMAAVHKRHGVS